VRRRRENEAEDDRKKKRAPHRDLSPDDAVSTQTGGCGFSRRGYFAAFSTAVRDVDHLARPHGPSGEREEVVSWSRDVLREPSVASITSSSRDSRNLTGSGARRPSTGRRAGSCAPWRLLAANCRPAPPGGRLAYRWARDRADPPSEPRLRIAAPRPAPPRPRGGAVRRGRGDARLLGARRADFAQQTREMLERKDLLVPYQNGKPTQKSRPSSTDRGDDALQRETCAGRDAVPSPSAGFLVFSRVLAGRRAERTDAPRRAMTATAPLVFWQGSPADRRALRRARCSRLPRPVRRLNEPSGPARAWAFPLLLRRDLTKAAHPRPLRLLALAECALRSPGKPFSTSALPRALLVVVLVVRVVAARFLGERYAYET